MNVHQLDLLDQIGNNKSLIGVGPQVREAVRAILAERSELIEACEVNLEFQTGTHTSIDEIMGLAEKCKRLTAEALAHANGDPIPTSSFPESNP